MANQPLTPEEVKILKIARKYVKNVLGKRTALTPRNIEYDEHAELYVVFFEQAEAIVVQLPDGDNSGGVWPLQGGSNVWAPVEEGEEDVIVE